ncbi:hypothetical protein [Streptosporangium sp. NPDC002524]|uniref:hypothetical protein n=1 Tax=Streptosporangium sp. NPDC002524 TaxID=3154537 RepID=UPI0033188897
MHGPHAVHGPYGMHNPYAVHGSRGPPVDPAGRSGLSCDGGRQRATAGDGE